MSKLLALLENLVIGIIKIFVYSLILFWIIGFIINLIYFFRG